MASVGSFSSLVWFAQSKDTMTVSALMTTVITCIIQNKLLFGTGHVSADVSCLPVFIICIILS